MKNHKNTEQVKQLFFEFIRSDRKLLYLALIYGVAISILTLSVPVSVQMLVNTIANTSSISAVVTLAIVLFVLLVISAVLNGFQIYILEIFERKFYARTSAEFTLKNVYANNLFYSQINRHELINRYFDIANIQKIVPTLIIGLFAMLLQMFAGLILVSFYHPWIFLFNIIFLGTIYMIWRVWGGKAIDTSIELSHAKYETARHLEEVARAHNLFNSRQRSNFAVSKADNLIINYLSRREDHFKFVFNQKIAFLLLYAFASSAFLGVGGYLVIINELTLGQLIASELILTTVFYGISRISYYLKDVYYLAASVDEISQVYDIPLEKNLGKIEMGEDVPDIKYDNAHFNVVKNEISINLDIKSCDKIMFGVESQIYEYAIIESLKKYRIPVKGSIKIGENNIVDIISEDLRDKIVILDSATVIESTIKEYLTIGNPNASTAEIDNALKVVGLYDLVYSFDKKLNTKLDISGRPFTPSETLRFKIANVLISKPKILILNELFDAISYEKRTQIFSHLCELKDMSLLYFSTRQDLDIFQKYIYISKDQCKEFKDLEDFKKCQY